MRPFDVHRGQRKTLVASHFVCDCRASNMSKRSLVPYSDSEDEDEWLAYKRRKRIRPIESDSEEEMDFSPPRLLKKSVEKQTSPEDVRPYYAIEDGKKRKSKLFRTDANTYKVSFQKLDIENRPGDFVFTLFNDIYEQLKQRCDAQDTDKIRISIYHPSLELGIFIPFANASAIKGSMMLDEIQKVMQSNHDLNLEDGKMTFEVTHTVPPSGSGGTGIPLHKFSSTQAMAKTKRSLVIINNDRDNMCLARAIVVGQCHVNKDDTDEWKKRWNLMRQSKKSLQTTEAMELLRRADVSPAKACGNDEYKKLQDELYPEYIVKIHQQHGKGGLLFTCPIPQPESKVIHVYYHQNHYDCITSMVGFLGCDYYCEMCDVGYKDRAGHSCSFKCNACFASPACSKVFPIVCNDCGRYFYGQTCFDNHKNLDGKQKKPICGNCVANVKVKSLKARRTTFARDSRSASTAKRW